VPAKETTHKIILSYLRGRISFNDSLNITIEVLIKKGFDCRSETLKKLLQAKFMNYSFPFDHISHQTLILGKHHQLGIMNEFISIDIDELLHHLGKILL